MYGCMYRMVPGHFSHGRFSEWTFFRIDIFWNATIPKDIFPIFSPNVIFPKESRKFFFHQCLSISHISFFLKQVLHQIFMMCATVSKCCNTYSSCLYSMYALFSVWICSWRSIYFSFGAAFTSFPKLNSATILSVSAFSFCGSLMAESRSGWCLPTTVWNRLCQVSLTLLVWCFLLIADL